MTDAQAKKPGDHADENLLVIADDAAIGAPNLDAGRGRSRDDRQQLVDREVRLFNPGQAEPLVQYRMTILLLDEGHYPVPNGPEQELFAERQIPDLVSC